MNRDTMSNRLWTISNGLSFLRIVLVAPLVILLQSGEPTQRAYAVVCLLVAVSTDLLDGWLARKFNQVTEIGKVIDPLADKVAVGFVVVTLTIQTAIPVWYLILVLVRDSLIFLGGMYLRRSRELLLQSNLPGKWAVTAVAAYILIVVLHRNELAFVEMIFLLTSTVLLIISFLLYLRRFLTIISKK
jgi:CDP-diacylglycerol--glycerol-3-phosphate 3-phosphatidyltransferase